MSRLAFAMISLVVVGLSAQAQVDCVDPKLIRVSRIQGHVFDPSGDPIPSADVSLTQGETVVAKMQTDPSGEFSFRVPAGEFDVRIQAKAFDQLHFRVRSGEDVSSVFRKSDIRAILSVAHLSCPWATTSNREFQQELKISRKRYNANATPQ